MKKLYYLITIFAIIFFLTGCKSDKIIISNMEKTETGYYLEVTKNEIDLKNYVSCESDYQITYNDKVISSKDSTIITLNNGSNYIEVISNEAIVLEFYLLSYYNVKYYYNNQQLYEEVLLEGSSLKEIKQLPGMDGSWSDQVIINGETVKLTDVVVNDDLIVNVIYNPCQYQVTVDGIEYTILSGEVIDWPVVDKIGHTFIGFNESIQNGMKYDKSMGTIFTSTYEKNIYSITLYIRGQDATLLSFEYGNKVELPSVNIPGYDFCGWYLNDELYENETFDHTSDIVLVAKLDPKTYVMNFTNIDTPYSENVLYNSDFTLPTPVKEGHRFLHWLVDGEVVTSGIWTYLENKTFVAVFEEAHTKKVSLNLVAFGGSVESEALVVDGYINLPTPKKEGYKFLYWAKDDKLKNVVTNIKESEYNNEPLYACYEYDSSNLIGQVTVTLVNKHASNYDELAMFDKTQSGFTSLYWHKVAVKKNGNDYIVSAIANNGEKLSTLGEYDFVILAYTSYSLYTDFVNMDYQVGSKVYFTIDPTTLSNGATTLQVSFVSPNIDEDASLIKEELAKIYHDHESISEDIDLVTNVLGYGITWKTSNKNAISTNGSYTKPYVTRNVTLSAYVGQTEIYSFTVEVIGENETSDALSTGYIYTPYTITQNAMDMLDIIYCAFLELDANGDWTNYTRMKNNLNNYILPKSKISGTKVVISVNQNSSGAFSSVASSAELREKVATKILDFILEFNLDGVDIDWETPASSEAGNFTLLMKAIYDKVKTKNPDYLVTAAIGGGKWAPPKYDLPNSKNYLDYINLMTYSMATGNGYYQNSLYKSTKGATLVSCSIEESIEIYNDLGVKNSQILVGIPFYTTVQTESGGPGSKLGSGKSVWYDTMLEKYPLSSTMIEYFDEECGVPYRYDATTKVFISYDNERSIMIKCDYINTLGLAGIMYWQYGQDIDDMLTNAIKEYINK